MMTLQKLLFDDPIESPPLPTDAPLAEVVKKCKIRRDRFGRPLPPLTYKQRLKRKLARERYQKRQAFLFGPRIKRKKKVRAIFALFPDVDDHPQSVALVGRLQDDAAAAIIDAEQSILPADILELGQMIIKERAAMVRESWGPNRLAKRCHFTVRPIVFEQLSESSLRIESRERHD